MDSNSSEDMQDTTSIINYNKENNNIIFNKSGYNGRLISLSKPPMHNKNFYRPVNIYMSPKCNYQNCTNIYYKPQTKKQLNIKSNIKKICAINYDSKNVKSNNKTININNNRNNSFRNRNNIKRTIRSNINKCTKLNNTFQTCNQKANNIVCIQTTSYNCNDSEFSSPECCDEIFSSPYCLGKCSTILFKNFVRNTFNQSDFNLVIGDDGIQTQNATGFTVTSTPFTFTTVLSNDNAKWLKYSTKPFLFSSKCETIFEALVASKQSIDPDILPINFDNRIRNIKEDIRLCSSAISLYDPITFITFNFALSDSALYAIYERNPNGKPHWSGNPSSKDYAAFSHAIRVSSINRDDPLKDFVRLGIGYNKSKNVVKWYMDGVEVLALDRIGLKCDEKFRMIDYGGIEEIVRPSSFHYGFGTFSLLNMAIPNDYSRDFVINVGLDNNIANSHLVQTEDNLSYNELYPDLDGDGRMLVDPTVTFGYVLNAEPDDNLDVKLFGQGSTIKIKYIKMLNCV